MTSPNGGSILPPHNAFEGAVAGLIMFQRGRRRCGELDALLTERGVTMLSPSVRKLIDKHVSACAVCQSQRRELVSAAAILRALALVALPVAVARRVEAALAAESLAKATAAGLGGQAATTTGTWGGRISSIKQNVKGGAQQAAIVAAAMLVGVIPGSLNALPGAPPAEHARAGVGDVEAAVRAPPTVPTVPADATPAPPPTVIVPPAATRPLSVLQPTADTSVVPPAPTVAVRVAPRPVTSSQSVPNQPPPLSTTLAPPPSLPSASVRGIPTDNPRHRASTGECAKYETAVKTPPAGNRVNVPCHGAGG